MPDVSVVICSYNPRADYFQRVLDALRDQTLPSTQWELLLVDNASTQPLASKWDLSWHPNARHILESRQGVTYARMRGIREISADTLVFVDDDNILSPDYLAQTIRIGRERPELGVWGSSMIRAEFEREPAEKVKILIPWLAVRDMAIARWSNVYPCKEATPWGAGMCVRASVAKAYFDMATQAAIQMAGRVGASLLSCEDVEIAYVACTIGLGMAVFPELKVTHLIPARRTTEDYLLELAEGTLTSEYLLAFKWQRKIPRNPRSLLGFLDMFANCLVRRGIQRRLYFAQRRAATNSLSVINRRR